MYIDKNRALKNILTDKSTLDFIMEAHNGLSARAAETCGFKALWASGLSIASSMGVRDCNEASWTQCLDIIEFMTDAVDIPVLMDGDTGYGNFNNVRRLVKKLCQKGVSGVCIEDKIFPKTNSFIGDKQPLASTDEFCGKIKAAKDAQLCSEFSVVARIEALISGHSMEEALLRAEAYYAAGADAILIHSKKGEADEIIQFASQCPSHIPLIIVPTKYFKTPTEKFEKAKISAIIWANHNLRASLLAMQNLCEELYESQSLVEVEHKVAKLDDLFRLLNYEELDQAERKYLP